MTPAAVAHDSFGTSGGSRQLRDKRWLVDPLAAEWLQAQEEQQLDDPEDGKRHQDNHRRGKHERRRGRRDEEDEQELPEVRLEDAPTRPQPDRGPHNPTADEPDAEFTHHAPKDPVGLGADEAAFLGLITEEVVQNGRLGEPAVAWDEPSEQPWPEAKSVTKPAGTLNRSRSPW